MRWDPLDLLDLRGRDGRVSFYKLVVVAILVWALARSAMTTALAAVLLAASFGRSTFQLFLQRNTVEVTDRRLDDER